MKVKSLTVENVGIIKKEIIPLNKPLNLFFGDIRQGKTTILNSIKLLFGGSFDKDLIRHGEKKAFVELEFDNASISRTFRFDKKGEIKAEPVEYFVEGKKQTNPAVKIKELLNPFLINQNHLFDLQRKPADMNKYFVDLFGVDTKDLDKELRDIERENKDLRIEIKAFGEIDVTEVKKPDVDALKKELNKVVFNNNNLKAEYDLAVSDEVVVEASKKNVVEYHNSIIQVKSTCVSELKEDKKRLLKELEEIDSGLDECLKWLNDPKNAEKVYVPEVSAIKEPDYVSTEELEEKISNAKADEIRYENYLKEIERNRKKEELELTLTGGANRLKEIKRQKTAMLADVTKDSPIKELSFDEEGNFTYLNTSAGMLSTSQLMQLTTEMSKMYPEGIGLELIDRGESLGKSIYEYVDYAKAGNKTILATIVGDRPANVPEEIGVFIVEDGGIL